eukprot:s4736_g2.t1
MAVTQLPAISLWHSVLSTQRLGGPRWVRHHGSHNGAVRGSLECPDLRLPDSDARAGRTACLVRSEDLLDFIYGRHQAASQKYSAKDRLVELFYSGQDIFNMSFLDKRRFGFRHDAHDW